MTNDEQIQIIIDNLHRMVGDPRLSGLTVREAALKICASERLADQVVARWTGRERFP